MICSVLVIYHKNEKERVERVEKEKEMKEKIK
jgi:hypothetical protein